MKIRARNKRSIAVMLAFMVTWICLCGLVSKAWALPTLGDVYSNVYAFAGNVEFFSGLPIPGQTQSNSAAGGSVTASWINNISAWPGAPATGSLTGAATAELDPDVSAASIEASGYVWASAWSSGPGAGYFIPPTSNATSTLWVDFTLVEATSYALEVGVLLGAVLEISSEGSAIVSASASDVGSVLTGVLLPGDYRLLAEAYVNRSGFGTLQESFDFSLTWMDGTGGTPVPEPCTIFLVGTGLIGLAGFRIRFRK